MARITFMYWHCTLYVDGKSVDGVTAECPRCGNRTESPNGDWSGLRRCAALMRKTCLRGERNIYSSEVFVPLR